MKRAARQWTCLISWVRPSRCPLPSSLEYQTRARKSLKLWSAVGRHPKNPAVRRALNRARTEVILEWEEMAMTNISDVTVHWRYLLEDDEGLDAWKSLYAFVIPTKRKIVYIGKAERASVAERLRCPKKDGMWERVSPFGIEKCEVLLGELALPQNRRLTEELLSDVESLLIWEEQPIGNVQNMSSRPTTRAGMRVACVGRWPGKARNYVDDGYSVRRMAG
jgi:hypothetical protein